MAARGGRGGGRGGAGGGRGGIFTPQLMGHLAFAEVIEQSKVGTDVLYPPIELPDTELSSTREAIIARRYNSITSEMKFTPYWINAPTKRVADIERWSDRFKPKASATITLATLNDSRKYARELLPATPAEILFDSKKRARDGEGRVIRKKKLKASDALGGMADDDGKDGESGSDEEQEEAELDEEDEEEEEDNDYEDNYFDNGEDDGGDGDALGGGGDEDGGTFD